MVPTVRWSASARSVSRWCSISGEGSLHWVAALRIAPGRQGPRGTAVMGIAGRMDGESFDQFTGDRVEMRRAVPRPEGPVRKAGKPARRTAGLWEAVTPGWSMNMDCFLLTAMLPG